MGRLKMPRNHSPETKAHAIDLYERVGLAEAANRLEGAVSRRTIAHWAKEAGASAPTKEVKRSEPRTYHKRNRLKLNDKLFRRIETVLRKKGNRITPNELRQLVLSYAIATDKRRLEEGENNQPSETLTPQDVYDEGQRRMIEMERRAEERYVGTRPNKRPSTKAQRLQLVEDVDEGRASRNK